MSNARSWQNCQWFGQQNRQTLGFADPNCIEQILPEGLLQNVFVKKDNGALGLILGGGCHVFLSGQLGEDLIDFWHANILGMGFVVEQNDPPHPVHTALNRAARIVFEGDLIADTFDKLSARLVKEFFEMWRYGR